MTQLNMKDSVTLFQSLGNVTLMGIMRHGVIRLYSVVCNTAMLLKVVDPNIGVELSHEFKLFVNEYTSKKNFVPTTKRPNWQKTYLYWTLRYGGELQCRDAILNGLQYVINRIRDSDYNPELRADDMTIWIDYRWKYIYK